MAKLLFDSHITELLLREDFFELLATLDFLTGTSMSYAIMTFQECFNVDFPLCKLGIISLHKLYTITCNGEEGWSAEVIFNAIKVESGYIKERCAVYNLSLTL
ncbi:Ubiquitin fusion degradation protein 4 [Massospora cicadina]|nr:Ubiquitin fusion degradation protein 4 [Massospora cicadina]